nr:MAG TPA: hypothetical protein [Caudoviricetes sp.]
MRILRRRCKSRPCMRATSHDARSWRSAKCMSRSSTSSKKHRRSSTAASTSRERATEHTPR